MNVNRFESLIGELRNFIMQASNLTDGEKEYLFEILNKLIDVEYVVDIQNKVINGDLLPHY